jgi:hypothetical protein
VVASGQADIARVSRAGPDERARGENTVKAAGAGLMNSQPDKTHPADWENPGRVKVQFEKDGRFVNPIVKNRASCRLALFNPRTSILTSQEHSSTASLPR